MRIQIKPIASRHITGFHAALDAIAREGEYLLMATAPAIESTRRWVEGNIERGLPQCVAVDEADRVVGWCDVLPDTHPGFEHNGRLGIGVLRTHRRQGIGRKLVEAALESARAHGVVRVELEVFASNTAAIRLYEEHGFELEGRRRGVRRTRGGYEDVLMMSLFLKPLL